MSRRKRRIRMPKHRRDRVDAVDLLCPTCDGVLRVNTSQMVWQCERCRLPWAVTALRVACYSGSQWRLYEPIPLEARPWFDV